MPDYDDRSARTSLLLVKPDGTSNPDKAQYIAESLAASPLRVLERRPITFRRSEIDDLWPKFASDEHAFTRHMLALYLTSGPSETIVVESAEVITDCRAVRSRVRHRFGDAAFENALHTPADDAELQANLAYLTGQPSFRRHVDTSAGPGRFGRFAELPVAEVVALAEALWAIRVRTGWEGLRAEPAADRSAAVCLLPGSDNSIDYEISAIADVFADRDLAWCAARLLEAERFGSSLIGTGGDPDRAIGRLSGFGVRAAAGEAAPR